MPLDNISESEIWKLRDQIVEKFKNRDDKWHDRRQVRFCRMDQELKSLPLNPDISDEALMVYQTDEPNQEVHKRTKRLVANPPRFEIVVFEDSPEVRTLAQELEDGLKALYKWMNRDKPISFEWMSTQYQQGDGLGIGKLDFLPGHGSSLADFDTDELEDNEEFQNELRKFSEDAEDRERVAYHNVTDRALRREAPPFRLSAPDPLSCYWWEDGDGIAIMIETGKKSLNPLLESFSDYGLKLDKNAGRLYLLDDSDALSGMTAPSSDISQDLSTEVNYTEIRTRDKIVILVEHPKIKDQVGESTGEGRGVVMTFDNPFGPYTTGYALIPGDITGEAAPEDRYQPPVLSSIRAAQPLNVLMTARLSAALSAALAPPYIQVKDDQDLPPIDEEKTPEATQNREIPVVPGQVRRMESPVADLERIDQRIVEDIAETKVRDALLGDATSDTSGHRLALQVGQADIQMVPYQNARKKAMEELMKGIVYAVKKHGLTVYIPTMPDGPRREGSLRVSEPARITPEMADLPFDLVISLGAETPVTKYAKWAALADREERGTIGYQTVVEQSDVENPEDEIARVFEGRALKEAMKQIIPMLLEIIVTRSTKRLQDAGVLPNVASTAQNPDTGLAGGGGGGPGVRSSDAVRVPGVNQEVVQTTNDFGPRAPEGAEVTT